MNAWRWAQCDRATLAGLIGEGIVLLPLGATEQHGPHLATGTDAILAQSSCERAAELAAPDSPRPLIVAPTLHFGASDHHLPFGGTLSLRPETLLAVLFDMARSLVEQGGSRLIVVNGHGGNVGVCHAFAAAAAARHEMRAACMDYWRLADSEEANVPGHAGNFETSLMLATHPDLVCDVVPRVPNPAAAIVADVDMHAAQTWRAIDGYTDEPHLADARRGSQWLDQIVTGMAARFVELARLW